MMISPTFRLIGEIELPSPLRKWRGPYMTIYKRIMSKDDGLGTPEADELSPVESCFSILTVSIFGQKIRFYKL